MPIFLILGIWWYSLTITLNFSFFDNGNEHWLAKKKKTKKLFLKENMEINNFDQEVKVLKVKNFNENIYLN